MNLQEREDIKHTFRVYYNVDVRDVWNPTCDCAAGARGQTCQHVLFVLRYLHGEDE